MAESSEALAAPINSPDVPTKNKRFIPLGMQAKVVGCQNLED